jgi:glutaminyl-tRNA synthetase
MQPCLNFGIASEFSGLCNLRFDDTNPEKESIEYVHAIEKDVHWLGFKWAELRHSSDYFEQLYDFAVELIEKGLAYVDSLNAEQMREYRGSLTKCLFSAKSLATIWRIKFVAGKFSMVDI